MPAPPPPPPTSKKPVQAQAEEEEKVDNTSLKSVNSENIIQIEEKITEFSEELEKLRNEKAKLLTKVELKEEEQQRKSSKQETEYEPFVQAHVINRLSSVSTDLSPMKETVDPIHSEPDEEEPHSLYPKEGLPEVIQNISKPEKEIEPSKIHSLSKEHELENDDIKKFKNLQNLHQKKLKWQNLLKLNH